MLLSDRAHALIALTARREVRDPARVYTRDRLELLQDRLCQVAEEVYTKELERARRNDAARRWGF